MRGKRLALGGVLVTGAALLAACGSGPTAAKLVRANSHPPLETSTTPPPTAAPATTPPPPPPPTCPLTGTPPPGGKVPQRPALAVKVENLPAARPQYGLTAADVVYEEPVEGGITRFIAIYQCHDAARIEPVRSGRLIDVDVVRQFGAHPLFAYAGAIPWVVTKVDSSPLIDVGIYRAPASDYWRDPSRYAPHNLVSSTAVLYAAGAAEKAPATPPPPVFTYGPLPTGATPARQVNVPYVYSDVNWVWSAAKGVWYRYYAGQGPAAAGEGGQLAATNVIVMKAVMYATPYVEDATGVHENDMILTGTGQAQIFRNGMVINGHWNRPTLAAGTTFTDSSGHVIPLTPGTTWVELVPTTIGVTVTP